jgi:hypothetical protein
MELMIRKEEGIGIIKQFKLPFVYKALVKYTIIITISEEVFELNHPSKCLILNPEDWHTMYDFTKDAILMVFASEYFDNSDYIFEPYSK